jgi:hypothetical protein
MEKLKVYYLIQQFRYNELRPLNRRLLRYYFLLPRRLLK